MTAGHEPLTPEERELARRLARAGAPAEPSPALDARILASARADAGPAPAVRHAPARRRPRVAWAAGLGVAASLLLAVGIAWQLRPLSDADVAYSEAPVAATAEVEPRSQSRPTDDAPRTPEPPPPPPAQAKPTSPASTESTATEQPQRARAQAASARDGARQAVAESAEAPVVFDDPTPVDAPAPTQPAPPPPPPAPAAAAPEPDLSMSPPAGTAAADAAPQEFARERKTGAEESRREAQQQRRAEAPDRIEAAGSRIDDAGEDAEADFADQPYDDEPPASADSPEVRKAWLSRIRELLGEGKIDAARASLAEFHRRYPQEPLPDELRPLLD